MPESKKNELEKKRYIKINDEDVNLYILLRQTLNLMSNAVDIELRQYKITQPQMSVLYTLSKYNKPLSLDELSDYCVKEFSSIYTLVNRMEKNGLVKKEKNKEDAKTYISLTEKGQILYLGKVTEDSIHSIFSKLSVEEKKQLNGLLGKLKEYTRDILGLDFYPSFLKQKE